MNLYGLPVRVSTLAVALKVNVSLSFAPKRRRKRWSVRRTETMEPAAFMMNLGATGIGSGQCLVMHPTLAAKLVELPEAPE